MFVALYEIVMLELQYTVAKVTTQSCTLLCSGWPVDCVPSPSMPAVKVLLLSVAIIQWFELTGSTWMLASGGPSGYAHNACYHHSADTGNEVQALVGSKWSVKS